MYEICPYIFFCFVKLLLDTRKIMIYNKNENTKNNEKNNFCIVSFTKSRIKKIRKIVHIYINAYIFCI